MGASLWARNLPRIRERTVLRNHLERLLSNFWALPASEALRALDSSVLGDWPRAWRDVGVKFARSGLAVRNALRRRSEHGVVLSAEATSGPSR